MARQTERMMDRAAFEALITLHGTETSAWPAADRAALMAFAATDAGRRLLQAEKAFRKIAAAPVPMDGADAFLSRLMAVPTHMAAAPVQAGLLASLMALFGDTARLFSPAGMATQGVAYALVLVVGVMTGMQSPAVTADEYDLSASLFAPADLAFEVQE